jgi:hypothetical protein
MFDTVAISSTFARLPNLDLLERNGCKLFFSQYTGEPYKIVLNGEKGVKEPRLTISRTPKALWVIKAEVSIGAWLFGSNIFLPNDNDMRNFFPTLSDFVRFKTGIRFDAQIERTTRADITRDFNVGESKVLSVIKNLSNIQLPKYNRKPINNTGIYFENKGKEKNKKYSIYSKYHDLQDKGASETELELTRGLLRLEIEHKNNRAVTNLAKSFKMSNHNANCILTREVSEKVIDDAMNLFSFQELLSGAESPLETLAKNFNSSMPLTLAGHLLFKAEFGSDYSKLPFINLKEETVKRYDRECAKTGISSLE